MGRGGKLGKLIRKWQAASKLVRTNSRSIAATPKDDAATWHSHPGSVEKAPGGLQAIYVGKSRRRYLISSHLLDHPLIRVLVDKSHGGDSGVMTVGCEVVLFEHMLWMLENGDPQTESLEELVEFYAY